MLAFQKSCELLRIGSLQRFHGLQIARLAQLLQYAICLNLSKGLDEKAPGQIISSLDKVVLCLRHALVLFNYLQRQFRGNGAQAGDFIGKTTHFLLAETAKHRCG